MLNDSNVASLCKSNDQLINFLKSHYAFQTKSNDIGFLEKHNIDITSEKRYKIAVLGDEDLVSKFNKHFLQMDMIDLSKQPSIEYDYGVIICRTYNINNYLEFNNKLFLNGKPYTSLLFSDEGFEYGPLIIPGETSCLNCKFLWGKRNNPIAEVDSIYYPKFSVSDEDVYSPDLMMGFGLVIDDLYRLMINDHKYQIIQNATQKVIEHCFTDGSLNVHPLLKNIECDLCFPEIKSEPFGG